MQILKHDVIILGSGLAGSTSKGSQLERASYYRHWQGCFCLWGRCQRLQRGIAGEIEGYASTLGQQRLTDIENLPMPVLAMIDGYCFGGGTDTKTE